MAIGFIPLILILTFHISSLSYALPTLHFTVGGYSPYCALKVLMQMLWRANYSKTLFINFVYLNQTHMKKLLLVLIASPFFILSNAQIITTVAGDGVQGYFGDGGQATAAEFYYPNAVGFDQKTSNIYVADESNAVIRMINASGVISTVAGNEAYGGGFSGDGRPATAAELDAPEGVWGDKHGNIYIADLINMCVRKVNSAGIISTFAGIGGAYGYTGDGGPATAAEMAYPYRLALDTVGNVYIVDQGNNVIRKVNTSGIISTFAGNNVSGYGGDGGPATSAELKTPYGISADISGNIYIADCGNNRIREVNTSGIITTVAGNGSSGFYGDGGAATAAEFSGAFAVAADAFGNLYVDDQNNQRIRVVNALGVISTFAGNGFASYSGDGGPATAAEIDDPWDVSVDATGNVYIADEVNQRVRFITGITTSLYIPINENDIAIYPNPIKGIFTIQSSVISSQWSVEIYNVLGERVYSQFSIQNPTSNIDLSTQSKGVYLYKVTDNYGTLLGSGRFGIE